jgi:hypothetical protein
MRLQHATWALSLNGPSAHALIKSLIVLERCEMVHTRQSKNTLANWRMYPLCSCYERLPGLSVRKAFHPRGARGAMAGWAGELVRH